MRHEGANAYRKTHSPRELRYCDAATNRVLLLRSPAYPRCTLQVGQSQSSVGAASTQASGAGTGSVGWQAPEVMAGRKGASSKFASDIFSLGCIFFAALVPGSHVFGEWFEREANIMKGAAVNLDELGGGEGQDLVNRMVGAEGAERPTIDMVLEHPFFWGADRRLAFLVELSDRLEKVGAASALGRGLEVGAADVIGTNFVRAPREDRAKDGRARTYCSSLLRSLALTLSPSCRPRASPLACSGTLPSTASTMGPASSTACASSGTSGRTPTPSPPRRSRTWAAWRACGPSSSAASGSC